MNNIHEEDLIPREFKVVENFSKPKPPTGFFAKYKERCAIREREIRNKSCECMVKDRQRAMAGLKPINAPTCGCIVYPKRPLLFSFLLWLDKMKENNRQRKVAGIPGSDVRFYFHYTINEIKYQYRTLKIRLMEWWKSVIHMPVEERVHITQMALLDEKLKKQQRTLAGIEPIKISPEVKEFVQRGLQDAHKAGIKFERTQEDKK